MTKTERTHHWRGGPQPAPLDERLFKHRQIDPATGCWEWTATTHKGYGRMNIGQKSKPVHRVSAHIWLGFDLDSPLKVCHHCDNRKCFNPQHLFVGTTKDNWDDMVAKGRRRIAVGQRAANAKLTDLDVLRIRKLFGTMPATDIANLFSISLPHVYKVARHRRWQHL